ncbi:hydrolase-like protein [Penicillium sp. DV-2018c]|nr:hydrolase-like protein [Penicillium sp. DV-2018c]
MRLAQTKKVQLPSGVNMFYREQTPTEGAPVILLLHGFPASSFQFRNLIPLLATKYRVIAPDLPGFGFTEVPSTFTYNFNNLAATVTEFLDKLNISKFSMYIFDYGAPTGLKIALQRPTAVQAIITQNGNAYVEGFGDIWAPIKELWASENAPEHRQIVEKAMLSFEAFKFQYQHGVPDVSTIAPESYTLDYALLQRPGNKEIQLDLFMDYRTNIPQYADFQRFFRDSQVPLLAIWGKNDAFFIPPGAEAFKRDLPKAEIKLVDGGHFLVESHTELIAQDMLAFLSKVV